MAEETNILKIDESAVGQLPISYVVRSHLEKASAALATALGEGLVSLTVYGSAARGEWDAASSDLNVAVVVDMLDYPRLHDAAATLRACRKEGRIVPMFLTLEDVAGARDVYCIKFADIAAHHVTIAGRDVFADLVVDEKHLAFVAEFELRNIAIRLRAAYVGSAGNRLLQAHRLVEKYASALFPLRALAKLLGAEVPPATPAAIEVIGEALTTEVGVLHELRQLHKTQASTSQATLDRLFAQLATFLDAAVARANAINFD